MLLPRPALVPHSRSQTNRLFGLARTRRNRHHSHWMPQRLREGRVQRGQREECGAGRRLPSRGLWPSLGARTARRGGSGELPRDPVCEKGAQLVDMKAPQPSTASSPGKRCQRGKTHWINSPSTSCISRSMPLTTSCAFSSLSSSVASIALLSASSSRARSARFVVDCCWGCADGVSSFAGEGCSSTPPPIAASFAAAKVVTSRLPSFHSSSSSLTLRSSSSTSPTRLSTSSLSSSLIRRAPSSAFLIASSRL